VASRSGPVWLIALATSLTGCAQSSSTVEPTTLSSTPVPTVACPAPVLTQSFTGLAVRVVFANPGVAGGLLPLTMSCSPSSGSSFPIGTTNVVCTVVDGLRQTFPCNFPVRVLGPPRVAATTYLAFGDSLTAGTLFDSYPGKLQSRLSSRYPTQSVVVFNDGIAGENAFPTGRSRLPVALNAHRSEALLLMEGANDLNGGSQGGTLALDALTDMVRTARGRGMAVFLATLPPQRPGGARDAVARLIPAFNDSVRALASREGATLVDVNAAFAGDLSLIGPDGLHPTAQGFEVMAQTFFNAIQQQLELPPADSGV
jgi:lysophospholipase L1-like esterase